MIELSELLSNEHEGVGYLFLPFVEQGPMVSHMILIHEGDGQFMHMHIIHGAHACSIKVGQGNGV